MVSRKNGLNSIERNIFEAPRVTFILFLIAGRIVQPQNKSTVPGEPFPKLEAISCLRKNSKLNCSPTSYVFLNNISTLSFLKQSFVKNKTQQSSA